MPVKRKQSKKSARKPLRGRGLKDVAKKVAKVAIPIAIAVAGAVAAKKIHKGISRIHNRPNEYDIWNNQQYFAELRDPNLAAVDESVISLLPSEEIPAF